MSGRLWAKDLNFHGFLMDGAEAVTRIEKGGLRIDPAIRRLNGTFTGRATIDVDEPKQLELTEFKLRASRGTAGNRPSFNDQFETFNFAAGGNLVKGNLGNRFLKPEHATETELGVDAILHDRYSLQLSYAKTKVVDQLIQIPLYGYYGFGNQWQNAGTVEGNTLEGTLEAHVIRRPDVNWRVGLVAAAALTRSLSTMLFGVSATDPVTFASLAVVMLAVAALASYLPARKALRVDPVITLRGEG
jgi:hypothetical protein